MFKRCGATKLFIYILNLEWLLLYVFSSPHPRPAAGRVDRQQAPGPQAAAVHARHSAPEAQAQPHPATQGREGGKTRVRRCVRHPLGLFRQT